MVSCANAGKHPAYKWSQLAPGEKAPIPEGFGIGLATGARSGVVVVDLDFKPDQGINGLEALIALAGPHGIPDTLTVATPTGGAHLYFEAPPFKVKNSASELAPGVDVRGDGGYVVLPPSPHKRGGIYEFVGIPPGFSGDVSDLVAPLPEWLAARIAEGTAARDGVTLAPMLTIPELGENQTTEEGWRRIDRAVDLLKRTPRGRRNATLFRVAADLGDHAHVGDIALEDARRAIVENVFALEAWDDAEKCQDTLERGFAKGRAKERPMILVGGDLFRMVEDASTALVRDESVYQRNGELVRLVRLQAKEVDGAPEGTPELRPMRPATLRVRLSEVADFRQRTRDGALKVVPPPDAVVLGMLESGEWPGVRPVEGFVEAPTLRRDGTILQAPGYDPATATIYEPGGVTFPPVPERPSWEEARAALALLYEPFADFPTETEAARLVAVAAVLTMLARGALEGENTPAFVFDANTPGAGKSKMCEAVAWIAQGRDVTKQRFPNTDKEELEKILGGIARAARPLVCFDNVPAGVTFGGDALEARITCHGVSQFRILGKTESVVLPWRTVILATGNNLEIASDMCRRVLRCRLVSPLERPEDRTDFRHTNLRAWVLEHRAALVTAGLTVLRAFAVAGMPSVVTPLGSFEAWSRLVAGAIMWAAGVNVLEARVTSDVDFDPAASAYAQFLAAFAPEEMGGRGYSFAELDRMPMVREVFDSIAPFGDRSRHTTLGRWLSSKKDKVCGDRVLRIRKDLKTKSNRFSVCLV